MKRKVAEWLHHQLCAAQNLPWEEGDCCDNCLASAPALIALMTPPDSVTMTVADFGKFMVEENERGTEDAIRLAEKAIELAAQICDKTAAGTVDAMSEEGRSDIWKIMAQQSVEQYESMARSIRSLKAALRG